MIAADHEELGISATDFRAAMAAEPEAMAGIVLAALEDDPDLDLAFDRRIGDDTCDDHPPIDIPDVVVDAMTAVGGASSDVSAPAPGPADPPPLPPPPEAPLPPGVHYDKIEDGGIVYRGGEPIGKMSRFAKSYGIRCGLGHKRCSIAVSSKCSLEDCVLWLCAGTPAPEFGSLGQSEELTKEHMRMPRPRAKPT